MEFSMSRLYSTLSECKALEFSIYVKICYFTHVLELYSYPQILSSHTSMSYTHVFTLNVKNLFPNIVAVNKQTVVKVLFRIQNFA